jgi:hypothetical protein
MVGGTAAQLQMDRHFPCISESGKLCFGFLNTLNESRMSAPDTVVQHGHFPYSP